MFPVGDTDVRDSGLGVMTILLLIINVLVFIFEATLSQQAIQNFATQFGVVPTQILQGRQLYTLLTSIFIHAGWLHLVSNMLHLWIFGDNVEAALGKLGYLLFYLAGGLVASVTHIAINPGSTLPSVGASGAIAAILGSYIVMYPRSRVKVMLLLGFVFVMQRVTAIVFVGVWAISQFFTGIASLGAKTAQTGGVAVWAHIGGFVFGLILGFLLKDRAPALKFERPDRRRRGF